MSTLARSCSRCSSTAVIQRPIGKETRMKSRTLTVALAVALLIVLSPAAKADGPITIGLNGAGTLSRNANVSWVRTGDYWANINPSSGVFNFGNADNIVNQALSQ